MDFNLTNTQRRLVEDVDRVLADAVPETDPRRLFARLGDERLVAVHWPEEYGGRGLTLADHAAVVERVGLHGMPDDVHLVTVQGVGCTLLAAGSKYQREHWLTQIGAGRVFASLLLSEEKAGGDLAAIETYAAATDSGYLVTGEKAWNLRADWSSFGLCAVRTRLGTDAYHGISVLLVPLDAQGVTVESVPRAVGEPYFRVIFDHVHVDRNAIVGDEHRGWSLIVRAIGFERAGFDYLTRAQRWLAAARRLIVQLPPAQLGAAQREMLRHERAVAGARALAFRAVAKADGLEMDEVASAYSKFACGDAAQGVAWWANGAFHALLDDNPSEDAAVLRRALAEAPELSVSGGASELLLDLIAVDQRASGVVGI